MAKRKINFSSLATFFLFSLFFSFSSLLAKTPPALKAENPDILFKESAAAWLDGRPLDAAGTLKYIVFMTSGPHKNIKAIRNLSAIFATLGKNKESIPYIKKWEIMDSSNPYVYLEKGWHYLAIEDYLQAQKALSEALTLTAEQSLSAEIKLLLSYCETYLAGPLKAIREFQESYHKYPYIVSLASLLASRAYARIKERQYSLIFLKQSLEYDTKNFQALIDLAETYDKVNYIVPAWQSFYTLLQIDPTEEYFRKKEKKLSKSLKGKKENLFHWTRLSWPVHDKPPERLGKKRIRIALFSNKKGTPARLSNFSFIANTSFKIEDSVLGKIAEGKPNTQWQILYDSKNGVYEVKDNFSVSIRKTRNQLKITPSRPTGIILIKSPKLMSTSFGVSRGDREIAGILSIIPHSKGGFILVNNTFLENCVSPITSFYSKGRKNIEELKAVAVVVRTKLLKLFYTHEAKSPYYDITDSGRHIEFAGLQVENRNSLKAVKMTKGEVLYLRNTLANVDMHEACGGITENGVNDNSSMPREKTPFALYSWTLSSPPANLLCLPLDKAESANVYWHELLDAKWIEKRANRKYKIGKLKSLIPLKRDKNFKVKSLRIEGTAKSVDIKGFKEISYILAAGTLRSSTFDIRPLFDGKFPVSFLLRGIGTGNGKGLCLWGARGMAENLGRKYKYILKHYFPGTRVKKVRI